MDFATSDRKPTFRIVAGVIVTAFVVFGAIWALNVARAADSPPPTGYATNSNGDTYGSDLDAATPDDAPDLIAVMATNGKSGYALKTDLEPIGGMPTSPADALAGQEARSRASAEAFARTLSAELTIPAMDLSDTQFTEIADFVDSESAMAAKSNIGSVRALEKLLSVDLTSGGASSEKAAEAIDTARVAFYDAGTRLVPVYQSDGETKVGVFKSAK